MLKYKNIDFSLGDIGFSMATTEIIVKLKSEKRNIKNLEIIPNWVNERFYIIRYEMCNIMYQKTYIIPF